MYPLVQSDFINTIVSQQYGKIALTENKICQTFVCYFQLI